MLYYKKTSLTFMADNNLPRKENLTTYFVDYEQEQADDISFNLKKYVPNPDFFKRLQEQSNLQDTLNTDQLVQELKDLDISQALIQLKLSPFGNTRSNNLKLEALKEEYNDKVEAELNRLMTEIENNINAGKYDETGFDLDHLLAENPRLAKIPNIKSKITEKLNENNLAAEIDLRQNPSSGFTAIDYSGQEKSLKLAREEQSSKKKKDPYHVPKLGW